MSERVSRQKQVHVPPEVNGNQLCVDGADSSRSEEIKRTTQGRRHHTESREPRQQIQTLSQHMASLRQRPRGPSEMTALPKQQGVCTE